MTLNIFLSILSSPLIIGLINFDIDIIHSFILFIPM